MTETVDIGDTIEPRSDQLNAEDLLTGPRTVTITAVRKSNGDQPVDIVMAEFGPGRPFKPSKTVRRQLVLAWGRDASTYVGRRMTLYRDPDVRFGGEAVGGIRVSHLSDIPRPLTMSLTETRGKRKPHRVEPLPDLSPLELLRAEWQTAGPDRRKVIEAEVAELQGAAGRGPAAAPPAETARMLVDRPTSAEVIAGIARVADGAQGEPDPTADPEFGTDGARP